MSETPEERLADMAEFMSMDGSALVAESVAKEHAADLRWSLSELSRLREQVATLTRERDEFARAVFMVGNMDTEEDKAAWWRDFATLWDDAADLATLSRQSKEGGKPIPCDGCGATESSKRCIGCLHDFGTPDSAWVRKYSSAAQGALTND